MKKLQIQKTFESPMVNFDPDKGVLEIDGRSVTDKVKDFYKPLHGWMDEYFKKPQVKTLIRLKFFYYNTSSKKNIMDILRKLDQFYKKGLDIKIQWQYEQDDEDMMEDGKDFNDVFSVPIEVEEV